jgi:hypothetical protein
MDDMEKMMQQIIEMLTKMKEDRKADQEDLLARIKEECRQANQELLAMFDVYEKRTMACVGQMEANTKKIETNPRMMQSIEEHQDIPNEHIAVMPVAEPRKRRRGRKSTAGRRGEPKERIRGICGSRRKLAAAYRKVSRHAALVW